MLILREGTLRVIFLSDSCKINWTLKVNHNWCLLISAIKLFFGLIRSFFAHVETLVFLRRMRKSNSLFRLMLSCDLGRHPTPPTFCGPTPFFKTRTSHAAEQLILPHHADRITPDTLEYSVSAIADVRRLHTCLNVRTYLPSSCTKINE